MLLFGVVQIAMSQIPNFHNMEWVSVIAAIMSFTYSLIGFALGFAKVIGICSHQFGPFSLSIYRNPTLLENSILSITWVIQIAATFFVMHWKEDR